MPTARKQPQDHLPAKTLPPAPADRIRMVTWEDHEYAIDPAVMDDLVFMELLADMETKPYLVAKVVARILGEKQWERFKANHADAEGRIASSRVGEFFDILNAELSALGN